MLDQLPQGYLHVSVTHDINIDTLRGKVEEILTDLRQILTDMGTDSSAATATAAASTTAGGGAR